MGEEPIRITVEFEPGDPVHGRLIDAAGADQAFYGWLELSRALECARERTASGDAGEPTGAGPAPSGGVR
jgi:hypothetical protein